MLLTTRALLVRDKRARMHELVRPVLKWDVGRPCPAATPAQYNALAEARTPAQLIEASDLCGPLRRMPDDMGDARRPLLLDASDVRDLVADGTFQEPDADSLIDECYFDPFFRLGDDDAFERDGRRPKADAQRVVRERGISAVEGILGPNGGEGVLFEVEPIQDWVLVRNLVSIAARFAGIQRMAPTLEEGRGTLERAGFVKAGRSGLLSRLRLQTPTVWAMPVLFNTWHREGNPVANSLGYPSSLINPLLHSLTEARSPHFALRSLTTLKGAPEVAFLSAWGAGVVQDVPLARDERPDEDHWTYLALLGDDQEALAAAYVRALHALLYRSEATYAGYESDTYPMGYRDVPTSLWATLMSHERHLLVTCRMCGRTVLATKQGPTREFCGDSCRTISKRRSKRPFMW